MNVYRETISHQQLDGDRYTILQLVYYITYYTYCSCPVKGAISRRAAALCVALVLRGAKVLAFTCQLFPIAQNFDLTGNPLTSAP